jgi:hypothetical protein
MTRTSRSRRVVAVTAALAALSLAACSGDEEPAPTSEPTASFGEPSAAPTLEVEPVVKPGSIVGRLARKDRRRVVEAVSGVAVRYLRAAYLTGDYPRTSFGDAFAVFTPGAARAARADRTLLTNVGVGKRVEEVTAARLGVTVDVLAVDGGARAATAHVKLVFRTTGGYDKRVQVQGRLRMTKQDGRWTVFAYEMSKGAR